MDDRYTEEKKMITPRRVIAPPTRYSTSAFPHLSSGWEEIRFPLDSSYDEIHFWPGPSTLLDRTLSEDIGAVLSEGFEIEMWRTTLLEDGFKLGRQLTSISQRLWLQQAPRVRTACQSLVSPQQNSSNLGRPVDQGRQGGGNLFVREEVFVESILDMVSFEYGVQYRS